MNVNELRIEVRARQILRDNNVLVDGMETATSYRQIAERLRLLTLEDRGPCTRSKGARHLELSARLGHLLGGNAPSPLNQSLDQDNRQEDAASSQPNLFSGDNVDRLQAM